MRTRKYGKLILIMLLISSFIIASSSIVTAIAEDKRASIPNGATQLNGHSYFLYNENITWPEAKKACENLGGHLVTISSKKENNLVKKLTLKVKPKNNAVWIGLSDYQSEGNWVWVTGETVSYTNWGYPQPDGGYNQNYACMYAVDVGSESWHCDPGQWDSSHNDYQIAYVCEWDTIRITKPTVVTDTVTDITQTSAKVYFDITDTGGKKVTDAGIQYGYKKTKTQKASFGATGNQTGTFSLKIKGLEAGKKVYYRAYATNSKGTGYGKWKTFTTKKVAKPTVKTLKATNVEITSATFGINITNDGGSRIIDCGILWGYSENTIKEEISFDQHAEGKFYKDYDGFKAGATVYYKAYATNAKDTAYGNVLNFTLEEDLTVPAFITFEACGFVSESDKPTSSTQGGKIYDQTGYPMKAGTTLVIPFSTDRNARKVTVKLRYLKDQKWVTYEINGNEIAASTTKFERDGDVYVGKVALEIPDSVPLGAYLLELYAKNKNSNTGGEWISARAKVFFSSDELKLFEVINQDDYNDSSTDIYYGSSTIMDAGCGLCAIVNSISYLNGTPFEYGKAPTVYEVRDYVNSIYPNWTSGGSPSDIYERFANHAGQTYGYKLITKTQDMKTLQKYLRKGCMAIVGVKHGSGRHIIAIGAYNPEDNRYLVLDSAGKYDWWTHSPDLYRWQKISSSGCFEYNTNVSLNGNFVIFGVASEDY